MSPTFKISVSPALRLTSPALRLTRSPFPHLPSPPSSPSSSLSAPSPSSPLFISPLSASPALSLPLPSSPLSQFLSQLSLGLPLSIAPSPSPNLSISPLSVSPALRLPLSPSHPLFTSPHLPSGLPVLYGREMTSEVDAPLNPNKKAYPFSVSHPPSPPIRFPPSLSPLYLLLSQLHPSPPPPLSVSSSLRLPSLYLTRPRFPPLSVSLPLSVSISAAVSLPVNPAPPFHPT